MYIPVTFWSYAEGGVRPSTGRLASCTLVAAEGHRLWQNPTRIIHSVS